MSFTLRSFILLACLFFVGLFAPLPLQAQEAVISDLVVANSKVDLLAFFKIDGAFTEEMRQGVLHGIPVTFSFDYILERVRSGWLDKEVCSGTFEHTMTYDSLKKEFLVVHQEGGGRRQLRTDDMDKAMAFMVEVEGLDIVALEEMRPDSRYTLLVKATLAKTTLPLNFHYIIPFTEFWDLKTEWLKVSFRY